MTYVPGKKSTISEDNTNRQNSNRTRENVNGKTCTVVIPAYSTGGTAGKLVFSQGVLVDFTNPT